MEISFKEKRALVTGAGKGIGRTIAIELYKCGAHVLALSRTEADLESLKIEYPDIEVVLCDLSNWEQARSVVAGLGAIDLLVNNAGMGKSVPFLEASPEEFETTMGVNLKAVMNVSQVVAKGMAEREGGAIVNISSQFSLAAFDGAAVYAASKGGPDSMTKVMALELGPKNVRVNAVNPTVIITQLTAPLRENPTMSKYFIDRIPLGRFGQPIEVAYPVLFLLSDKASMINGVLLPIDGGFTAC